MRIVWVEDLHAELGNGRLVVVDGHFAEMDVDVLALSHYMHAHQCGSPGSVSASNLTYAYRTPIKST